MLDDVEIVNFSRNSWGMEPGLGQISEGCGYPEPLVEHFYEV